MIETDQRLVVICHNSTTLSEVFHTNLALANVVARMVPSVRVSGARRTGFTPVGFHDQTYDTRAMQGRGLAPHR